MKKNRMTKPNRGKIRHALDVFSSTYRKQHAAVLSSVHDMAKHTFQPFLLGTGVLQLIATHSHTLFKNVTVNFNYGNYGSLEVSTHLANLFPPA